MATRWDAACERLGPEEAVAFLEEHVQAVEDDIKKSTREERHEMRLLLRQVTRPEAIEGNLIAIAKRMVQEALPNWRSIRADNLLTAMQQKPELWGVRFGGRCGVAFLEQNVRGFWDRLFRRSTAAPRVSARWEDGTKSIFAPEDTLEWCILPFPASP